jgi:hypothetical protein
MTPRLSATALNHFASGTPGSRWAGLLGVGVLLVGAACSPEDPAFLDSGESTDAGRIAVVDGGKADAGTLDAGTFDAGTLDAGTSDAGTSDAGTFDAGTFDAGTFDAGTFDAGTFDAGTFDGGPCAQLPQNAKLGTLVLQPGFVVHEGVTPPGNFYSFGTRPGPNGTHLMVGLSYGSREVFELGTWPTLVASATPLFNFVAPADRQTSLTPLAYVAFDGTRFAAGYYKSQFNLPGSIATYNPTTGGNVTYTPAETHFSVTGAAGLFLISANSLGTLMNGHGIYALDAQNAAHPLATFDSSWAATGGLTGFTSNQVAVLGYSQFNSLSSPDTHTLHAVAPAALAAALNSPLALGTTPQIYSGTDLYAIAGFGDGIALFRGKYNSSYTAQLWSDVSRIKLTVQPNGSVTAGPLTQVLSNPGACADIESIISMGDDLLVVFSYDEGNERRLVRIGQ